MEPNQEELRPEDKNTSSQPSPQSAPEEKTPKPEAQEPSPTPPQGESGPSPEIPPRRKPEGLEGSQSPNTGNQTPPPEREKPDGERKFQRRPLNNRGSQGKKPPFKKKKPKKPFEGLKEQPENTVTLYQHCRNQGHKFGQEDLLAIGYSVSRVQEQIFGKQRPKKVLEHQHELFDEEGNQLKGSKTCWVKYYPKDFTLIMDNCINDYLKRKEKAKEQKSQ